ncbi:MAG: hypothetical protein EOO77_12500 [Oxalobacteraceae bacterium]|nr:MAG: hypothetical protein EOO77_12500 [Oxalobacteraceae bacterium]
MTHSVAMTPFDTAAILIVLAAVFGNLHYCFLHLPQSVGLTVMDALASPIAAKTDRPSHTAGLLGTHRRQSRRSE